MEVICEAAVKAGKFALEKLGKIEKIDVKSHFSDVVTDVDYACQKMIVEIIKRKIPDAIFVLEEGKGGKSIPYAEKVFLIDPIDGTLNYSHSLPFFGVSIARLDKGQITEAAVYAPFSNELFYAKKGFGAFLNGKRIYNERQPSLKESLLVTGIPYDQNLFDWTFKSIYEVSKVVQEVRILGSAAVELCYVSCGRLDGYWEIGLKPWDIAAGVLIASESGIQISGIKGDFDLEKGEILASVKSIHEDLKRILGEIV
ncbi:inositol monophosphatase family protein [Pseudothermotoga thermarum]|uniref:Inositol-1-monophosphatase n=1 Tax=Pseudothermotoga thermarum DSM 5069 TaxID=688269 RepID=F7YWR0_9THEM|nr:inositol monophosphatase family protein [Pseudothermotoga thermarum]AEH52050.1 inositol monophosphatase [Pseudothermotoga thermarum DSM 5069]